MSADGDLDAVIAEAAGLRDAGRNQEARALLLDALPGNRTDPLLNYHLGWVHDRLGREAEAVPYYEAALAGDGLDDEDTRGALLGLGSTYRALGRYADAVAMFRDGVDRFPAAGEFKAFLAMALYNEGEARDAVRILLEELAASSTDPGVMRYREAINFYASRLDETW